MGPHRRTKVEDEKKNLTKYRKNISKNRYYPLKFLEFRVESPKGNESKEIQNFKETTFFDMSSAQLAEFQKSDKVSKNVEKNRYYPLKFLESRVESPKGNEIKEILNFKETK